MKLGYFLSLGFYVGLGTLSLLKSVRRVSPHPTEKAGGLPQRRILLIESIILHHGQGCKQSYDVGMHHSGFREGRIFNKKGCRFFTSLSMDREARACYHKSIILTLSVMKLRIRCKYGVWPRKKPGPYFRCRTVRYGIFFFWREAPWKQELRL